MIIRWNIKKERGNLRPRLSILMRLSDNERGMCVPVVRIDTDIPKPPDAGWRHCLPGENERRQGWRPTEFHSIQTPNHRDAEAQEELVLPWRDDNEYPEIETAMRALRDRFEREVRDACDSAPIDESGELETSADTKRHLAPSVAAQRILQLVNG